MESRHSDSLKLTRAPHTQARGEAVSPQFIWKDLETPRRQHQGISVRGFLDRVNWGEKTHNKLIIKPTCNKQVGVLEGRKSGPSTSISLCCLLWGMGAAALPSCHHAFLTTVDCTPQTVSRHHPFLPHVASRQIFIGSQL